VGFSVSVHASKRRKPLAVNHENRDNPVFKRIRENADALEHRLELSDAEIERVARELGLGTKRGPNPLPGPEPTPEAWRLARRFELQAIKPLGEALASLGGPLTFGNGWSTDRRVEPLDEAGAIGLPLLGSVSNSAMIAATHMIAASHHDSLVQVRDDLRVRLTHFLAYEDLLWELSAANGGPTARIPYAYRHRAIEWFWTASAHKYAGATALCLRCGKLWMPRGQLTSETPLCTSCGNQPRIARRWPDHAIAPAERGTFWLQCEADGCKNVFLTRAQAHHCPPCETARTTPNKRPSRRSNES
jgi:hypothetical protein